MKTYSGFCIIPPWESNTQRAFFDNLSLKTGMKIITTLQIYSKKNLLHSFSYLKAGILVLIKVIHKFFTNDGDFRKVYYESINLGFSINERAISRSKFGNPSFFLILKYSFYVGIKYVILKNFLQKNKISLVLAGDEAYPDYSILLQLSNKLKIKNKVLKGGPEAYLCDYQMDILTAMPDSRKYKKLKNKINSNQIAQHEKILKNRIKNSRDDLFYMDKINKIKFKKEKFVSRSLWIYQHDFFDSPGVFGDNLFINHYQWIIKTILFCRSNKINFYIKAHPNNREASLISLRNICDAFNLGNNLIFDDLSISDIKSTKPIAVCSVYGSIIAEAAYAGIPVINCGRNPYETYKISYRANTIKEYFYYISLASLNKLQIADKEKVIKTFICGKKFLSGVFKRYDISWDDINSELWKATYKKREYPKYWERIKINLNPIHREIYDSAYQIIRDKNLNFELLFL